MAQINEHSKNGLYLKSIIWDNSLNSLMILDQTLLPNEKKYIKITSADEMWEAIKKLRVRGAPAIGIAAAFGVYAEVIRQNISSKEDFLKIIDNTCTFLASSRPTAVNLFWALQRLKDFISSKKTNDPKTLKVDLFNFCNLMLKEDELICDKLGEFGSSLIKDGDVILTHCNAGCLATAGIGTALAAIYKANNQGKKIKVFADETRPLLQGSRLTAFELSENNIDITLICDNMAASLMKKKSIDLVIVGADRVSANGDVCNKIGTYSVACLAKMHNIPFYVSCPISTVDMSTKNGDEIIIEQRDHTEVSFISGIPTAPKNVNIYNPAFDVTPANLITAIITENGIIYPPFDVGLKKLFSSLS